MVPLVIGTDAGDSGRPPAHTVLVGFKPSFGAVPYGAGFEEPPFGVSSICRIDRTVAETALAFTAMAGRDARDPFSGDVLPGKERGITTLRIAAMPRWGFDVPVDPDVREAMAATFGTLRRAGCDIVGREPQRPVACDGGLQGEAHPQSCEPGGSARRI